MKRLLLLAAVLLAFGTTMTAGGKKKPQVPRQAGAACKFQKGVRYSELVINSRINDFYANTKQAGFGVYDSKGKLLQQPKVVTWNRKLRTARNP